MASYIFRRLLSIIPLVLILSLITFVLLNEVGDPLSYYVQANVTGADLERLTKSLGLDRPVMVRYFDWLVKMVTGDWGDSLVTGRPVTDLILERLPATLLLTGTSFLLTLIFAIPLGIYAAIKHNKTPDRLISSFSLLSFSAPTFWTGIMAIVVFSLQARKLKLPYLPSGGMYDLVEGPSAKSIAIHLILPATILMLFSLARYVRFMRNGMIDSLDQDYIRTARAKGLNERLVIYKHALRNSILPIVTLISVDLPRLLAGALITEQVFAWPGMGRLMVEHSMRADYPVLMGILVIITVSVAVLSIVADIIYVYIDPRIQYS